MKTRWVKVQGDQAMTGDKATADLVGSNPPAAGVAQQEEGQHKSKVEKVKEALHLDKKH